MKELSDYIKQHKIDPGYCEIDFFTGLYLCLDNIDIPEEIKIVFKDGSEIYGFFFGKNLNNIPETYEYVIRTDDEMNPKYVGSDNNCENRFGYIVTKTDIGKNDKEIDYLAISCVRYNPNATIVLDSSSDENNIITEEERKILDSCGYRYHIFQDCIRDISVEFVGMSWGKLLRGKCEKDDVLFNLNNCLDNNSIEGKSWMIGCAFELYNNHDTFEDWWDDL